MAVTADAKDLDVIKKAITDYENENLSVIERKFVSEERINGLAQRILIDLIQSKA